MKSNFIMSFLILGLLASCGGDKKSSSTSGGPGNDKNTDALQAEQFKESYQFSLNGCDTGKHNFSSNSREDVKKKLCDALQDDKLNNSCAEPLRKDFFNKKCVSLTWSPKYPSNNNDTGNDNDGQVTNNNTPSNNWATERKIRDSLQNLVSSKVTINDQIDGEEKDDAEKLAQNFSDCTFSYTGPKCLNNYAYGSSYLGKVYKMNEEEVFFVELDIQNIDYTVALVFSLKNKDENYSSQKVTVYKSFQKFNAGDDFASYIADESFVLELFSSSISENSIEALIEKAKKPNNLREQYHASKVVLDIAMRDSTINYQEKQKELLKYFNENNNLIAESEDSQYQYSMLTFVKNTLASEEKDFIAICEKLIDVDEQSLKQYAIVHVFENDPTRDELKEDVLEALNHNNYEVRVKAVEGLGKTELSVEEQNIVLMKLDDSSQSVRNTVRSVVSSFDLTDDHLSTIDTLQDINNYEVRVFSATLMGKVSGEKASSNLIDKMSDTSQSVRQEVRKQLFSRVLSEKDVPALEKQFQSNNYKVRVDVAKLLGKIGTDKALLIMISKMSDSSQSVRNEVIGQLAQAKMKVDFLSKLDEQRKSSNYKVRRDSIKLISTIEHLDADILLIKSMSDSSQTVRNETFSQLEKKSLNQSHLDELTLQKEASNYEVRVRTIKLIGTIAGDKATNLIIGSMSDSSQSVRSEAVSTLKGRTLTEANADFLITHLNGSNYETRKNAALLLGKIKSQKVLDALIDRLAIENSSSVKEEIKRSIDKIK